MKSKFVFSFLLVLLSVLVTSRKLPSYIHRCHRNDPDPAACFVKVVNEIRPHLVKGIPELNLNPIDPMIVPKLFVTNYTGASLGVDAELTNMTFYGGKNFVIKNHTFDFNKGETDTVLFIPKLDMVTKYRIKGKVLFLDIDSSGKAEGSFEDILVKAELSMKKYKKNGKIHLKFEDRNFDVNIRKAKMNLDDLFPNNPEISINTNKVINENMDVLIQDMKPIVLKTTKNLVLNMLNRVYDLYTFDELWPIK